MNVNHLGCCGVREMANIMGQDPALTLKRLCEPRYVVWERGVMFEPANFRTGSFIFTEAGTRSKYGRALRQYIEANKLGTVTAAPPFKNRNTGRKITLFVWAFDYAAVKAWYERKGWESKPPEQAT
jgi:hypothetical protein